MRTVSTRSARGASGSGAVRSLPPNRSIPLEEERQSEKTFALCLSLTSDESTLGTWEREREGWSRGGRAAKGLVECWGTLA